MDIIHLLPDSVANQIAAGEVIQRPASVVKELVENSIDAGATKVQIIIKDAGRTLVQVIDNGCGMSVTDARMAFERHATSKIQQATDLFSLHTMGFRGEALPSIAAVSEIELRTMRAEDVTGTKLVISASKVEEQVPELCTQGTNIMVKRLFFNLPARRKFLKKDTIELGHIIREFERLALVNTNVEFAIYSNDTLMHQLPAAPLKKRICDLFGKNLDHQYIPVSTDTSLVKIDGFVSLPQFAKRRLPLQYFFVNGRYMRHPYFHKAVLNCFDALIPSDSQPNYFIKLEVDPETIDVNIHPQKYEIKFENEQPIWQILSAAIKEALGRFNASAAIDFNTVDAPDIPAFHPDINANPSLDVDLHYNPFKAMASPKSSAQNTAQQRNLASKQAPANWEKLYDALSQKTGAVDISQPSILNDRPQDHLEIETETDSEHPQLINAQSETPTLLQLKGRYIVLPSKSGLMLIDQHRAHILILYDKYISYVQDGKVPSQRLIFPESVTLDATQNVVANSICDLLETMGFDVANLGGTDWSINAMPAMLGKANPAETLINILNAVTEEEEDVQQNQWQKIALSMAKSAAIKYGTPLSQTEMDNIVSDLFHLSTPDYTPDGHPIIRIIGLADINKMF